MIRITVRDRKRTIGIRRQTKVEDIVDDSLKKKWMLLEQVLRRTYNGWLPRVWKRSKDRQYLMK